MTTLHQAQVAAPGGALKVAGGYGEPAPDDPKLRPPRQRRRLVARTALVTELLATQVALVTVVAPPGYGKSTLLAQWCRADPRPSAWVNLDDLDNDPAGLLAWLAVAVSALPGAGPAPAGRLTGRKVGAMLAACDRPVLLVMDDAHVLDELGAIDTVTNLLPYLPEGSVLALGSRTPPVSLGRLRVALDVLELGPAELAFDEAETAAAVAAEGVTIDRPGARSLYASTEGWPAVVTLAAVASRGGAPLPLATSGDARIVAEYLHSEVMASLEPETAEFLHRSAVLERLSGPACDAVLGRTGSAGMLTALAAENQLVLPVDAGREHYRYHPLLRDLLLAELAREQPQELTGLRHRAAAWCSEHGDPWGALRYEYDVGDLDAAADRMVAIARPAWAGGHSATVEHWLELLERAGVVDRRPELAALWAVTLTLQGQDPRADGWADRALSVPADSTGPVGGVSLPALQAMLRALRCVDGPEQMHRDVQQYLGLLPPTSAWVPTGVALAGIADLLDGELDGAADRLGEAAALARRLNATGAAIGALGALALLRADQQQWDQARSAVREGMDTIARVGFGQEGLTGVLYAAAVRVCDHDGDTDACRAAIARFDALRPRMTYAGLPYTSVMGRLAVARVHLAHGEWEAARTLVGEMQEILGRRPHLGRLVADVAAVAATIGDRRGGPLGGSTLSVAELRLLPLLTTHLSFRGIGERMFLSQHTIKTQALSIYRKLGATSRDEAVTRARELGLIDD